MPPGAAQPEIQWQFLGYSQEETNSTNDECNPGRTNVKSVDNKEEEEEEEEEGRKKNSEGGDHTMNSTVSLDVESTRIKNTIDRSPGRITCRSCSANHRPERSSPHSPPTTLPGSTHWLTLPPVHHLLTLLTLALTLTASPVGGNLMGMAYPDMVEYGRCASPQLSEVLDLERFGGVWYQVGQEPNSYMEVKQCIRTKYIWDGTEIRTETRGLDKHGEVRDQLARISQVMPIDPTQPRPYLQVQIPNVPPVPYHIIKTDYSNFACVYSCFDFLGLKMEVSSILNRTPLIANSSLEACQDSFRALRVDLSQMERVIQGPECWYWKKEEEEEEEEEERWESQTTPEAGGLDRSLVPPSAVPITVGQGDIVEQIEDVLDLLIEEIEEELVADGETSIDLDPVDAREMTSETPRTGDVMWEDSRNHPSRTEVTQRARKRWRGRKRFRGCNRDRNDQVGTSKFNSHSANNHQTTVPIHTTKAQDQAHQDPGPTEGTPPRCTCNSSSVQTNTLALFASLLFCSLWAR